jgi:nitrogen fixation protein NifB
MKSEIDFSSHPCFSREAHHKYGRVHLPVAPRCNLQCNFCNRKYDCVNESRPGVTSSTLTPQQALAYLEDTLQRRPEIRVVGIAGPGDPFANAEETMETLRLVRARFPEMMLCLASNGLGIGPYIDELARLKTSHVTITVTAVDPEIGAEIYAWVRDGKRPLRGVEAAKVLLERQLEAIKRLKALDIIVKVNSIIVPGVNDEHIPEVARTMAGLGVDLMNCMALVPVQGSAFEDLPEPDAMMTARVRLSSGLHLPQMSHCARCRADAAGLINEKMSTEQIDRLQHYASTTMNPEEALKRPYVAVASMEGALVNQHLGEADRFLVYEPNAEAPGSFRLVEIRPSPEEGGGDERWENMAELLKDCRALLVNSAGARPQKVLGEHGLKIVEMEGLIDEGLKAIYAGQPVPAAMKRRFNGCGEGMGCRGTGTGCG